MKVALISHEGGGISSVSYGLAYSLSKRRIPTTIITGTPAKSYREKLNECLNVIHLHHFDFPPRNVWFQVQNMCGLWKLLRDHTVIHGVSPDASVGVTYFKKRLNKPLVTTIHGVPFTYLNLFIKAPIYSWTLSDFGLHVLEYPLHHSTIRRCLAKSNHIVSCSLTTLNQLTSTYKKLNMDRISVIYNGLNFDKIENIKTNSENDQNDLSIIFAGRLYWIKGVMFLLKAFETIKRDFKDLNLKIFGKGPLKNRIINFISKAGLKDSICLGDHIPHMDLLAEIKKSDVVVFPSLSEAQPMFVLEAMACKKPLVVFDRPFALELITNMHNGLIAESCNVKDLSEKIRLLLLDEKLRLKLGQNAYQYVRREHNWETLAENYIRIYEKVTDN